MQLDYLDLCLNHWLLTHKNLHTETWKPFTTLYNKGLIKAIGVSNFKTAYLHYLIDESSVILTVDQIQRRPNLAQSEMRQRLNILNINRQDCNHLGRAPLLLNDPTPLRVTD